MKFEDKPQIDMKFHRFMKNKNHSLGFIIPERKFEIKSRENSINLKPRVASTRETNDRQSLPLQKGGKPSQQKRGSRALKLGNSKSEDKKYLRNRDPQISKFKVNLENSLKTSGIIF